MKGVIPDRKHDQSSDPFMFLRDGGKKIVNFAITNYCNAKCKYCSFHLEKNKKYVKFDVACSAIDYLNDINTGVLALTGGEPLLNPDISEIVKYARKKGLIVYTGTNSLPLTPELAKDLKKADISAVWISFESSSYQDFDSNRGVSELHKSVKDGVQSLTNAGVTTFAISLINKSIRNFDQLVKRLLELGFDKVKFDYPMNFKLGSSYKGWSTSPLLDFSSIEMETAIKSIIKIKRSNQINVINPISGLKGAIDFYNSRTPKFPCFAGDKVLYLDWDLDIYRCPALAQKMGSVGDSIDFNKIECNTCYYQGVRDYDSFFYLLEKFDNISKGLKRIDPTPILSTINSHELKRIYYSLYSAWEIKGCGLV
jgi:MoaA/NifB/PqqE/SkfB family radical SAM enzyme